MRICSLLPSATEIAFALGLGDRLVGVSHTCDFPPAARRLPVLTRSLRGPAPGPGEVVVQGTPAAGAGPAPRYALDGELLRALAPDVILTQDICDVCAIGADTVFEVAARVLGYAPAFVTVRAAGLEDILQSILTIGRACDAVAAAQRCVAGLRARIAAVRDGVAGAGPPRRVLALEWTGPPIAAGLWTAELVGLAGGTQDLTRPGDRSRRLTWDEVAAFRPEVVLLLPCGCALDRAHAEAAALAAEARWRALPAARDGQVYVFDGRVPSRHGPRTVDVLEAFAEILHPRRFEPRWRGRLYDPAGRPPGGPMGGAR